LRSSIQPLEGCALSRDSGLAGNAPKRNQNAANLIIRTIELCRANPPVSNLPRRQRRRHQRLVRFAFGAGSREVIASSSTQRLRESKGVDTTPPACSNLGKLKRTIKMGQRIDQISLTGEQKPNTSWTPAPHATPTVAPCGRHAACACLAVLSNLLNSTHGTQNAAFHSTCQSRRSPS